MDRNLLLAFVLSFLVLYGWSAWQQSMQPPEPPPGVEQAAESPEGEEVGPAGGGPAGAGEEPAPAREGERRYAELPAGETTAAPAARRPAEAAGGAVELQPEPERIQIERPLYEAVLTARGAALESWKLKSYHDQYGDPVVMVEESAGIGDAAATPFLELGLGDLSQVNWRVVSADASSAVFAIGRGGLTLRKTWEFEPNGYAFRLRLDVENASGQVVAPRFLIDWPTRVRSGLDFKDEQLAIFEDGTLEHKPVTGIGRPGLLGGLRGARPAEFYDYEGEIDWAGVHSTYFLASLLPDSPSQASARIAVLELGEAAAVEVYFDPVDLPSGQSLAREFRGYVGPKETERLEAMGGGLIHAINLGWSWVAPLTRGFSWLLAVLYSFIPNYGLGIIILTLLVRGVTAPLTVKQMRSMERLRRVQPRMKEIQEKYADDRQKQSEEMMRLYRQEKVNPLGGCLPMVLQLPVFIGLFYALRSSIALRQAPFFGWIHDLSAPEALFVIPGLGIPFRVLPLVMGVTMFVQQKITPMQTPDPTQARMMATVMPIMMTVLFYQFPSGLVLYWMMSNLLAIGHQLWIGRNMGPPGATAESGNGKSGSPAPKAA